MLFSHETSQDLLRVHPSPRRVRSPRCRRHRAAWRSCVATFALVALVSTSLGPLPWLFVGLPVAGHDHAESALTGPGPDTHRGAHEAAGASREPHSHAEHAEHVHGIAHDHRHYADASDIPGSPTHPLDHDCAPCQVLKHLSRCTIPLPFSLPAIALQRPMASSPQADPEPPRAVLVASLPPVRAPPFRST